MPMRRYIHVERTLCTTRRCLGADKSLVGGSFGFRHFDLRITNLEQQSHKDVNKLCFELFFMITLSYNNRMIHKNKSRFRYIY